jgi:hypothetical protein
MFDLVLTARPTEQLVIATQLGFDQEDVELEWAFAEWRFDDAFRLRAGKVKQPLGNYMELQFVGTARPFFTLPTSVYGPAEIGAASYSGVGFTGEVSSDSGWALQYDGYGGAIELDAFEPFEVLEPGYVPETGEAPTEENEELLVENIVGGRVSLASPWGVTLRLSGYGGKLDNHEASRPTLLVAGVSLLYRGEKLWVSTEAFQSAELGAETHRSAYAEVAWFLTPHVQLATRYEAARTTMEDFDGGSPLLRHDEVGAGVNYWFNPQLVVKGSFHLARGKKFARDDADATSSPDRTRLFVAGAQFMF